MKRTRPSAENTPRQPVSARELAFQILKQWNASGDFASRTIEEELEDAEITPVDRRLAMQLVYGVIRRQTTLAAILRPFVHRPWKDVERDLQTILVLGAFQLVFLDRIPSHAAVFETVELARRNKHLTGVGFLNGVLRALERTLTGESLSAPATNALPLGPGEYRRLDRPVFPDPKLDPLGYFTEAFGFPEWLAARWLAQFGKDELFRLGGFFNSPPGLCLRVNLLKVTRDRFLTELAEAGMPGYSGAHEAAVWLDDGVRVTDLPGFYQGWFAVQDQSGMGAATLLDPQAGQNVLDLCAAPGGKTTHLAERMQNSGHIVAVDVDEARLALIDDSAKRLEHTIIKTRLVDRQLTNLEPGQFDAALVDVPCSNTGVIGKRPEVRWRLKPSDFAELSALQQRLLRAACDHVKPGGRIVYSTCSIDAEENRTIVDRVLRDDATLRFVEDRTHVPGLPADGGYQALILKSNQAAGL